MTNRKSLDCAKLRDAVSRIKHARANAADIEDHTEKQAAYQDILISTTDEFGGRYTPTTGGYRLSLAGVTSSCTSGPIGMLHNWTAAAERALERAMVNKIHEAMTRCQAWYFTPTKWDCGPWARNELMASDLIKSGLIEFKANGDIKLYNLDLVVSPALPDDRLILMAGDKKVSVIDLRGGIPA